MPKFSRFFQQLRKQYSTVDQIFFSKICQFTYNILFSSSLLLHLDFLLDFFNQIQAQIRITQFHCLFCAFQSIRQISYLEKNCCSQILVLMIFLFIGNLVTIAPGEVLVFAISIRQRQLQKAFNKVLLSFDVHFVKFDKIFFRIVILFRKSLSCIDASSVKLQSVLKLLLLKVLLSFLSTLANELAFSLHRLSIEEQEARNKYFEKTSSVLQILGLVEFLVSDLEPRSLLQFHSFDGLSESWAKGNLQIEGSLLNSYVKFLLNYETFEIILHPIKINFEWFINVAYFVTSSSNFCVFHDICSQYWFSFKLQQESIVLIRFLLLHLQGAILSITLNHISKQIVISGDKRKKAYLLINRIEKTNSRVIIFKYCNYIIDQSSQSNKVKREKQQIRMEIQKTQSETPTVQNLKNLLTDILLTNTAYDCMPINSLISSIDKSISLFDAVNILLSESADQLMVWDQQAMKWIWMLTLVDATRLILHALRTYAKQGKVDFSSFQSRTLPEFRTLPQCTEDQIHAVVKFLKEKKLHQILKCLIGQNQTKSYVRLKSVIREAKLSYVILTMIVQKIHRILIEDSQSKMIISVLNFKDVLLYLLRIANESSFDYYSTIQIHSLLQNVKLKDNTILSSRPIWQAFEMMVDGQRSLWINVVDQNMKFKGMLFRQDFRDILMTWRLDSLWKSAGDFLQQKKLMYKGSIPEFRFFQPNDTTKDIIWKIVMTRKNAIIWVDQQGRIKATIGLMELFSLYVQ